MLAAFGLRLPLKPSNTSIYVENRDHPSPFNVLSMKTPFEAAVTHFAMEGPILLEDSPERWPSATAGRHFACLPDVEPVAVEAFALQSQALATGQSYVLLAQVSAKPKTSVPALPKQSQASCLAFIDIIDLAPRGICNGSEVERLQEIVDRDQGLDVSVF